MRPSKVPRICKAAQLAQALQVDDRVALRRLLDLVKYALLPLRRMIHYAGAGHVQIDVHHTAMQMLVCFNGCGVVAILPERAFPPFAPVVFLPSTPGDKLHALGNDLSPGVFDQRMYVIGCDNVIQDAQTEAPSCLKDPMQIAAPIARELQEKFPLMAAMRDVPDMAREKVTVCSWHPGSLEPVFLRQKSASKP